MLNAGASADRALAAAATDVAQIFVSCMVPPELNPAIAATTDQRAQRSQDCVFFNNRNVAPCKLHTPKRPGSDSNATNKQPTRRRMVAKYDRSRRPAPPRLDLPQTMCVRPCADALPVSLSLLALPCMTGLFSALAPATRPARDQCMMLTRFRMLPTEPSLSTRLRSQFPPLTRLPAWSRCASRQFVSP